MNTEALKIASKLYDPILEPAVGDCVQAHIESAIIAALGDSTELIKKIIQATLNQKVEDTGVRSLYPSSKSQTFLDYVCANAIRTATTAAVQRWVKEKTPEVEALVFSELESNTHSIAQQLCAGFVKASTNHFRINVTVGDEVIE